MSFIGLLSLGFFYFYSMGKKVTFPTPVPQGNAQDVAIAGYYAGGLSQISFLAHTHQRVRWLYSRNSSGCHTRKQQQMNLQV